MLITRKCSLPHIFSFINFNTDYLAKLYCTISNFSKNVKLVLIRRGMLLICRSVPITPIHYSSDQKEPG